MNIMASGPITSWQIGGETMETVTDFIFLGSKITADDDCSHEVKTVGLGRKVMTNLDSIFKSRHYSANKGPCSQSYDFSSNNVQMFWELEHKEGWVSKNWCFWAVVLEKTPESPLDCKEIKPVNSKRNQPWMFIGRTDTEAEAPIFWSPGGKKWVIRKDCNAEKDWGQEEKGMTENKMVGWPHWLNGCELEQPLGIGERQGSLMCCSPWGLKKSQTGLSDSTTTTATTYSVLWYLMMHFYGLLRSVIFCYTTRAPGCQDLIYQ